MSEAQKSDNGGPDHPPFAQLDEWRGNGGVDLPNDADAAEVFAAIREADCVRIAFPSFADGRGFTLARRLRQLGFTGRLRAAGHVLPDQYRHTRRSGFDELETDGGGVLDLSTPPARAQAAGGYRERLGFF